MLVIAAPSASYSTSELDAIEMWVKGGGSLLLVSDYSSFGTQSRTIASRFNITMKSDMILDSNENVGQSYWPYYSGANLRSHQITAGVTRVEMYASDGIVSTPVDKIPLIVTDTDGTATWQVGGSASGVSVMSAFNGGAAGRGKLVVITDSSLWSSNSDVDGDTYLNFYDSDNEILALNTIDWLAQPDILIVNDNDGTGVVGRTSLPVIASALNAGNLDYWVWDESKMGRPTLGYLSRFELVIWTCGDYYSAPVDSIDAVTLQSYIAQGGNLLLEGEDIGYNHISDSFMVNVAHAIYKVDNAVAPGLTVTDTTHRVTAGLPASFTWMTTPTYPDGVNPTNGGFTVLNYTGTSHTAVTAFDSTAAGGSVVYYSFPLYCLKAAERETLTLNSVAWLTRAPRILSYVAYTDYDEEYLHSLQAIDSSYAEDYILTEFTDYTKLGSMLLENDILFIPEQETATLSTMQTIGASWSTSLSNFLAKGGVIIVCDYSGGSRGILTGAGLMSISSTSSIVGSSVYRVDSEDRLTVGVANSFIAPSGALRFVTTTESKIVFNDGTYPVVIHKTIGAGQIALIGFDYFQSNPDADQILGNAIALYSYARLVLYSRDSYDFSTHTRGSLSGGDFYYYPDAGGLEFWANNVGQRGLQDVGNIGGVDLSNVPIPTSGYTRFGVNAVVGHTYVSLAHQGEEGSYIVFRVTSIMPDYSSVTIEYLYPDTVAPIGSIIINSGNPFSTTTTAVTLYLTYSDATSGVYQVRYSNDGVWDTEPWENPSPTKAWTLTSGAGLKTVWYQVKDNAGLVSTMYSDDITLTIDV